MAAKISNALQILRAARLRLICNDLLVGKKKHPEDTNDEEIHLSNTRSSDVLDSYGHLKRNAKKTASDSVPASLPGHRL